MSDLCTKKCLTPFPRARHKRNPVHLLNTDVVGTGAVSNGIVTRHRQSAVAHRTGWGRFCVDIVGYTDEYRPAKDRQSCQGQPTREPVPFLHIISRLHALFFSLPRLFVCFLGFADKLTYH